MRPPASDPRKSLETLAFWPILGHLLGSNPTVKSMTHGNPTEYTHALSLEKENENERLPKRLHHTAIFDDHSDQSRRVALWQAWHTAESYLRSRGGAYAAFFNLPHARAL